MITEPTRFQRITVGICFALQGEGLKGKLMMRIQKCTDGNQVVFALSGRIEGEDVAELQRLCHSELEDHNLILDLRDVRLVNRDAVRFLAEADGIRLRNCPAYIREWIARERDEVARQGQAPSKVEL